MPIAQLMDPLYGIDDPKRRQLLAGGMALDALPSDGLVTHPLSPAGKRRRAQETYWRSYVWPAFFSGNFPDTTLSTAVNLVQKNLGPGAELEYLIRHLYQVMDNPHKVPWGDSDKKSPVAPFMASLRYALLPPPTKQESEDEVARRREQRQEEQPERTGTEDWMPW